MSTGAWRDPWREATDERDDVCIVFLFFGSNVHYNYNVQGSLASGRGPAIIGRSAHTLPKGRAWTCRRDSAKRM